MHPQLQEIFEGLESAERRLEAIAREVPEASWPRRADPNRWSIAECVAHLNMTSVAYVPILRDGIERARRLGGPAPRTYRRDPLGWMIWKSAPPPVRFRVRTTAPFVPQATAPAAASVDEFQRLQREQIDCVKAADGLPLDRIRITSPFSERLRYNLFAALSILPRHQHRHLWQAEQVWQALQGRQS